MEEWKQESKKAEKLYSKLFVFFFTYFFKIHFILTKSWSASLQSHILLLFWIYMFYFWATGGGRNPARLKCWVIVDYLINISVMVCSCIVAVLQGPKSSNATATDHLLRTPTPTMEITLLNQALLFQSVTLCFMLFFNSFWRMYSFKITLCLTVRQYAGVPFISRINGILPQGTSVRNKVFHNC